MTEGKARARFALLIERDPVPLDEAALALAEEEYPRLEAEEYLVRLDRLADRVRVKAPPARAATLLHGLRKVLFEEEGYRGNELDYSDPRNSFLNEVVDRRVGLPITLCILYMEVARRAGLTLQGVGFPGHFLAKYVSQGGAEVFVDPSTGARCCSADECVARYRARTGGRDLDRRYLAGVAPAADPRPDAPQPEADLPRAAGRRPRLVGPRPDPAPHPRAARGDARPRARLRAARGRGRRGARPRDVPRAVAGGPASTRSPRSGACSRASGARLSPS